MHVSIKADVGTSCLHMSPKEDWGLWREGPGLFLLYSWDSSDVCLIGDAQMLVD